MMRLVLAVLLLFGLAGCGVPEIGKFNSDEFIKKYSSCRFTYADLKNISENFNFNIEKAPGYGSFVASERFCSSKLMVGARLDDAMKRPWLNDSPSEDHAKRGISGLYSGFRIIKIRDASKAEKYVLVVGIHTTGMTLYNSAAIDGNIIKGQAQFGSFYAGDVLLGDFEGDSVSISQFEIPEKIIKNGSDSEVGLYPFKPGNKPISFVIPQKLKRELLKAPY
jgi:hypothetical protein